MNKKQPTWFGFNLNLKQAVRIFIFALIGFLICALICIIYLNSIFMSLYYNMRYASLDPYYDLAYEQAYVIYMIISGIPLLIFFTFLMIICTYSMSRCRKTSKYYREFDLPDYGGNHPRIRSQVYNLDPVPNYDTPLFCSNCGAPRKENYQFCTNCGFELQ